jgi:hypothetical protein
LLLFTIGNLKFNIISQLSSEHFFISPSISGLNKALGP